MSKRSKSNGIISETDSVVERKRAKNKKNKSECNDANMESKPEEAIITSNDKQQVLRKDNSTVRTSGSGNTKKNKIIKFNDDDDEPIEVNNPPTQHKRPNQEESSQQNEEDIKDEDIDKFCDELNEEDNEQYENWVKLIEAKLHHSNKKKPK